MTAPWRGGAWIEAREALLGQRGALATGLALMLVNRAAAMVVPASSKWVIDDVIGKHRVELLPWLVAAAGGAVLIEAASAFSLSQVAGCGSQRAVSHVRRKVVRKLLGLPVSYHEATQTGGVVARLVTDPESVREITGSGMIGLLSALFTAVFVLVVMYRLNAPLTAVLVPALLIFGFALTTGFGRLYPAFRDANDAMAEMSGRLGEILGGIKVVKANAAERREEHRFTCESHRLLRRQFKALRGVSTFRATNTIVTGVVSVTILTVGARAVLQGSMTVGEVVTYLFFAGLLIAPVVQISSTVGELGDAWAALARIHDLRILETESEQRTRCVGLRGIAGHVDFYDVSYAYAPGPLALKQVNLHVRAGSTVALVGPNGSGKSTICRLVAAFDDPTHGRILVDDRDLAFANRREYRRHLGMVLQETNIFDGTIEENIRYGAPRAPDAAFTAAAKAAHCQEFVCRLPNGYQTRVGEGGVQLSGGQRQRVAIARALLRDPRILILDEATCHLDSESLPLIEAGLQTLRRGRTTFVIAHRPETTREADQVIVLKEGEIVGRGAHEELFATGWGTLGLPHVFQACLSRGQNMPHLSIVEAPSVAQCLITILRMKVMLRLGGLGSTLAWMRKRVARELPLRSVDLESLRICERRVASVAAIYPGRALCLEQSLALYYLLRNRGIALTFVMGVRPVPFTAHAWIEHAGIPLNDVEEHVAWFTPFPAMLP